MRLGAQHAIVPAMPSTDTKLEGSHGALHVRRWDHPDPSYIALIAHGIGEHAGRYEHVAQALVDDGAVVWAPDHYGHGHSDGERAQADDVEAFVDDLHLVADAARAATPGLPVVLVGHSLGGLIATRFAQRHQDELSALVLSAPAIGGNPQFEALLDMDPMPDVPIDPATLSRDPAVGEAYMADELIYHGPLTRRSIEGIYAGIGAVADGPSLEVPTLWQHGTADELLPRELAGAALGRIRTDATEEKSYPDARHEIYNETNQDEVIADAITFVRAHNGAAVS